MEEQASPHEEKVVKLQRGGVPLKDWLGKSKPVGGSTTSKSTLVPLTKKQADEEGDLRALKQYQAQQKERDRVQGLKQKGRTDAGDFVNDMGTNMVTLATQFRTPNQEDLDAGRGGWQGRANFLMNGTSHGLANEMTGGLMEYGLNKYISGEAGQLIKKLTAQPGIIKQSVKEAVNPYLKAGQATWKSTEGLPLLKRTENAVNSATLAKPMKGDITSHSYFTMSPDEVKLRMSGEARELPQGALTTDRNMSLNSSPLLWNNAARQANNASRLPAKDAFTIIRTGKTNVINDSGFKGKDIYDAIPDGVRKMNQGKIDLFEGNAAAIRQGIKEGDFSKSVGNKSINEARDNLNGQMLFDVGARRAHQIEFLDNMVPAMDKGIRSVNEATGLQFPGSFLGEVGGIPKMAQPDIVGVKNIAARRSSSVKDMVNNIGYHYKINNRMLNSGYTKPYTDLKVGLAKDRVSGFNFDNRLRMATEQSHAGNLRPWEIEHEAGLLASLQTQGINRGSDNPMVNERMFDILRDRGLSELAVMRPYTENAAEVAAGNQLAPPPSELIMDIGVPASSLGPTTRPEVEEALSGIRQGMIRNDIARHRAAEEIEASQGYPTTPREKAQDFMEEHIGDGRITNENALDYVQHIPEEAGQFIRPTHLMQVFRGTNPNMTIQEAMSAGVGREFNQAAALLERGSFRRAYIPDGPGSMVGHPSTILPNGMRTQRFEPDYGDVNYRGDFTLPAGMDDPHYSGITTERLLSELNDPRRSAALRDRARRELQIRQVQIPEQ